MRKLLNDYFHCCGRASRTEYLRFCRRGAFMTLPFLLLSPFLSGVLYLFLLFWIMVPLPVTIRRFHDRGYSGAWILVIALFMVALLVVSGFWLTVFAMYGIHDHVTVYYLSIAGLIVVAGLVVSIFKFCLGVGDEAENAYGPPSLSPWKNRA